MISVFVNNQIHQFTESQSVSSVLKSLGMSAAGIAVAVNSNVVSNTLWNSTTVKDGDKILIIKATQGG